MKKLIIILAVLTATSFAQTGGISFMLGYPQGEFRKNVDNIGFGVQLQGTLWAPTHSRPFTIGFDLGYIVYGQVNERRPWIGFPGVYLNLQRTNSMANLHFLMQVSPFFGTVRPYIEGLFGGAYIFTESEVKNENLNQKIASSTNFDDFAWNYGYGAGILFKVSDGFENVGKIYLDFKARYLYGTEAEYLTEESVITNSLGDVIFQPKKSKTDFFTFHIGVIAYFNAL
ncbi:MAG: hypothetical protein N2321_02120 [Melioribacteraceae bacterium]|nr:hypothetical protein [Melioribacteraceae bacterium]